MLQLFFALYGLKGSNDSHVALFATEMNQPLTGNVNMFQIITQPYGHPGGEDGFILSHESVSLVKSGRFVCAMRLPCVNMTMQSLEAYMASQYPGQRGSAIIESPTNRWGCFQWAMRSIKGLIDNNDMVPESSNSLFTPRAANHVYWGKMILFALTKARHDVLVDPQVADRSTGIRMMHFEAHGVHL